MIWQPTATQAALQQRANLLRKIRDFFWQRNVMEVSTPVIAAAGVSDPYLVNLTTTITIPGIFQQQQYFLQTSPEYHMKRLLASGSGSIYQLSPAFRDQERGRAHNIEFTMLEWYRIGFDHHALMQEVDELLQLTLACPAALKITYHDLFMEFLQINPHTATLQQLQDCAAEQALTIDPHGLTETDWLQLLLSTCIEPKLVPDIPVFIYDFPGPQAALAKCRDHDNYQIAERFEVYMAGIELANGYHELTDHDEQLKRFAADQQIRNKKHIKSATIDEKLLAALAAGLPACAGVALGFDRLCMIACQQASLADVISFSTEVA